MKFRCEELFDRIDSLNTTLFKEYGASVAIIEPVDDEVRFFIVSRCGTVWMDIPRATFSRPEWDVDVLDAFQRSPGLLRWISDVSFGSFRKSELYLALCSRFVMPTQMASGIAYQGNTSYNNRGMYGLASEDPSFIITGLEHQMGDGGLPELVALRGEIPCADEFYIWGKEISVFANIANVNLADAIGEVTFHLVLTLSSCDWVTARSDHRIPPLHPQSPSELLIMHRTMGTLRRGVSVGLFDG